MFNNEGECGTGAVVPWADRLWVLTYAPHAPKGSSDKLYEITPDLRQIIRPESIGGTPANRMIHAESQQLFIGPYAIDAQRHVRAIPYDVMFGRPTANARHLFDPAGKIYFATMEEGLYEVDVRTLDVTELWADEQRKAGQHADLPGYHGKGMYSTQGRLVYANNGEHGSEAQKRPDVPSGVLAEWDGKSAAWTVVLRNQFTEVTGPGGIHGNAQPNDPVWSIGWDHRSLILMCLADGRWHRYRLPKASHSYDGAHGWNTEWPRIRDIGEDDLLMTMHGMFWKFPKNFGPTHSGGIQPRSTYLKVIGDFCRWQDRIVLGCDDTAKNEFLNKRKAKGEIAAPQSQSNLWFIEPEQLDHLGPVIGRGAVWLQDDVPANTRSDAMLLAGLERRGLHFSHQTDTPVTLKLQFDRQGAGRWEDHSRVDVEPNGSVWIDLSPVRVEDASHRAKSTDSYSGVWYQSPSVKNLTWIRITSQQPIRQATAWFTGSNPDNRSTTADAIFDGLAEPDATELTGGIVRARGENKRTLHFVSTEPGTSGPQEIGLYELNAELELQRVDDPAALAFNKTRAAIPTGVLTEDAASIIFVDEQNQRWRLPRGSQDTTSLLPSRVCREVATERDLFNAGGTFFELPAENAGGFAKVRAVATHNRQISDYCSYRGLFVMSGLTKSLADIDNPHIIRSDDGRTALWVGAIDDVWKFGKPRGTGGPWQNSPVEALVASDPYLMTGYDRKTLELSHTGTQPITFRIQCDINGSGHWQDYQTVVVPPGETIRHEFPVAFMAYWLRVMSTADATATAQLTYE